MISYTGKKVRLRPLRVSDKSHTQVWRNDPDVRENALGYRFPVTDTMDAQWFDDALKDQCGKRAIFAIEDLADSACIGIVQLNRIDWIARLAYLSIVIGDMSRHGKGLGADAIHVLFRYGFGCLNLRKVCLEVPAFNERARRLYAELGFTEEGTLKEQLFLGSGYHDIILMGLFREAYEARFGPPSSMPPTP